MSITLPHQRPASQRVGDPEILLTVGEAERVTIFSNWSFYPETPLHIELSTRISEQPSVPCKWSLSRTTLRYAAENVPYKATVACIPANLEIGPSPLGDNLIRITLPANQAACDDDEFGLLLLADIDDALRADLLRMEVSVDIERSVVLEMLDLLDRFAPITDDVVRQELERVVDGFIVSGQNFIDFSEPTHLMARMARRAKVHRINRGIVGHHELPSCLYRDHRNPGELVVELIVGASLRLAVLVPIAKLAAAIKAGMLGEIDHGLPPDGISLSDDVILLGAAEFIEANRPLDGRVDDLQDEAAAILRVNTALCPPLGPLDEFEILLSHKAMFYFRLLVAQWTSEQADPDAADQATLDRPVVQMSMAAPAPVRVLDGTVQVTTEADGRTHPFAPDDEVQYRLTTVVRKPGRFRVVEVAWAQINGDHPRHDGHARVRLVDADSGEPVFEDKWRRADDFELVEVA